MTNKEAIKLIGGMKSNLSDFYDYDDLTALDMAISALSAEGELTNEKAIAFLQDNGWLVEHDRIMTSGSAEGEYIKKEDLLNSVTIQDSPYGDFEEKVVTIEDIEKLPVYSFSERENDYMKTVRRDCGLYE